ncbi:MAG: HD domain-containing protein [Myxococcota bacterium]
MRDSSEIVGNPSLSPCYSERVERALSLMMGAFGTNDERVPRAACVFISHAGRSLEDEWWGDEDQVIAALLHDYLEDIPGASLDELKQLFGGRVAAFVSALSDQLASRRKPAEYARNALLIICMGGPDQADRPYVISCTMHVRY